MTPGDSSIRSEKRRPLSGKIGDGPFVEESRDGAGLSIDESGRAGDGDFFLNAGYGEAEFEFGGGAYIDVELRGDLRRHACGEDAGGVVAGREQVDGEAAFGVGGGGVACAGGGVDYCDRLRRGCGRS